MLEPVLRGPGLTLIPPSPSSPSQEAHVVVRPGLGRLFAKEPDRVVVPELDLGSLEVICRVIGQSAALDFYTRCEHIQNVDVS